MNDDLSISAKTLLQALGFDPDEDTEDHAYTNIGKPFEMGGRMVCWATEMIEITRPAEAKVRKCLLDAETRQEIHVPLDLGSHVVYPQPGGPYMAHGVVDSIPPEQQSLIPLQKFPDQGITDE